MWWYLPAQGSIQIVWLRATHIWNIWASWKHLLFAERGSPGLDVPNVALLAETDGFFLFQLFFF